jgi:hypothetical protein
MLMPVKQNSFTHPRVLLALTNRGVLAQLLIGGFHVFDVCMISCFS